MINDKNKVEGFFDQGVNLAVGKFHEALDAFNRSIELDPDNSLLWVNKGFICSELKHYSEALEAYDRSIELDPDNSATWSNKGLIYSK